MVDIVVAGAAVIDSDHASDEFDEIAFREGPGLFLESEPSVQLVTTDAPEVVFPFVKEQVADQFACIFHAGRLTRSQPTIKLKQSFFLSSRCGIFRKRRFHVSVQRVLVHVGH